MGNFLSECYNNNNNIYEEDIVKINKALHYSSIYNKKYKINNFIKYLPKKYNSIV
jgi:hypothetical protein